MFQTTRKIVPKVVKHITPWYIRWIYSICGDRFNMASSSIVPVAATTSDSVVSSRHFRISKFRIRWKFSMFCFVLQLKSMDANRYATKKTIAQGMLDIALLTANASQLKYILQVGQKHEFYTLMLILISVSIIMQVNIIMDHSIVVISFNEPFRSCCVKPFDFLFNQLTVKCLNNLKVYNRKILFCEWKIGN